MLQNGRLPLSSPIDGGVDAGADAAALGRPSPGTLPGDEDPEREPQPVPDAPPRPVADLTRPIRALGEEVATPLLGGFTGRDDRARCVEGLLVGLDYRFNDSSAGSFPSRLTFVRPVCALPNVIGDALDLSEPADLAWSEVDGDGSAVEHPETTHQLRCPQNYAVVGLKGSVDELSPSPQLFAVRELELQCAPLLLDARRVPVARGPIASVSAVPVSPAPGSIPLELACDSSTTAATGAVVRWGSWLDGVGLQCQRLTWPFTSGQGCAVDSDCQSGSCNASARCGE